jgi:2-oxoacid:acceptor oxidoreductase gamma subunit (pyruvate/2-ketoisovalerate family)/2-oxoacid:acceptor oxidoreductase delta subunit (pyruvate/2-ketoisovalerate family)
MLEIRFHGRGGQGAVVASELLAHAAFFDGKMCQSFPFFGVERRGAPVTAYTRIDSRPIGVRTSITRPDVVVVLDPGLLRTTPVTDGMKAGGILIVNTRAPAETLYTPVKARVAVVDANKIALDHRLGSATMPIVNTAVLGAVAKATGIVSLKAVDQAIEEYVPARRPENRAAAADGYNLVRIIESAGSPERFPAPRPPTRPAMPDGPIATVPSDVYHTSAWRTIRPVIALEKCTKCNFCWKFCPDDAIEFESEGFPVIRVDYCKGCGICAEECPPHAIAMVAEE